MSVRYVKSSWISYAVASALAALVLFTAPAESWAKKKNKQRPPEELTNFLLGPSYSQWLVGAISLLADESEIDRFLKLTSDEQAEAFIADFWAARRDTKAVWPAKQPQGVFESRAREADSFYSEGPRPGRRSARGAIYIVYGAPESEQFEVSGKRGNPVVEVWEYPKDAAPGLNGESPRRYYYFVKKGEYTVETSAPSQRRLRRVGGAS